LLCLGSLLLVPIVLTVHPPIGEIARDLVVPRLPESDRLSDVLLLIIAIVGTTVAPWQLFFQQSYVIDKRITPRFMAYEKADLWIGVVFVMIGAIAMMAFCAAAFSGQPEAGNFTNAGGVAIGLAKYAGQIPGTLFAIALIDASIIGASAVSLATAYALGDVLSLKHSLHRRAMDARGFCLVYCGLIAAAAALVLIPGSPLGLITEAVQTLAGVLLPSATVFLLLLCNDKAVLGPWVNGRRTNLFAGSVIAILVMLSIVLTVSVLYPSITGEQILFVLGGGTVLAVIAAGVTLTVRTKPAETPLDRSLRPIWRMRPLTQLAPARLTTATRVWMIVLRGYLVLAVGLVIVRVVQLALRQ
jgi:Mn2+/Fe2+ NRAMP family transporter